MTHGSSVGKSGNGAVPVSVCRGHEEVDEATKDHKGDRRDVRVLPGEGGGEGRA